MHLRRVLRGRRHLWVHAHAFRRRRLDPTIVGWMTVWLLLVLPSGVNVTVRVENLRRRAWHGEIVTLLRSVHILVKTLFSVSAGLRFLHLGFLLITWGEEALHLLIRVVVAELVGSCSFHFEFAVLVTLVTSVTIVIVRILIMVLSMICSTNSKTQIN